MPNQVIDSAGNLVDPTNIHAVDSTGTAQQVQSVKVVDSAGNVSTIWVPETIVDDFEHNALSTYYNGGLSNFNIQSTTVAQETYALEGTSAGFITSHSGLQNYPSRGDTWKINLQYGVDSQPTVFWCVADEGAPGTVETGYYFEIDESNNNLNVWEYDGNYNRFMLIGGAGGQYGNWVTVEVTHNADDSMNVALKSLDESTTYASGSGTPSNVFRGSGGVKFRKRGPGNQYFDYWRIM